DRTVRLWNAEDGSPLAVLKHEGPVQGAAFSRDEARVLTYSDDGTARLWKAKDGSPLEVLEHDGPVWGAVFSRDESRVLSYSSDGTARIWDIQSDLDFPVEYLPLLVEVATGTTMDERGFVTALNDATWKQKRKEYIDIADDHLKLCQYRRANLYLEQKRYWK
ncbi:MAG: hypothetical protein V3T83_01855, partial [Acidobacteriota bacterium]